MIIIAQGIRIPGNITASEYLWNPVGSENKYRRETISWRLHQQPIATIWYWELGAPNDHEPAVSILKISLLFMIQNLARLGVHYPRTL